MKRLLRFFVPRRFWACLYKDFKLFLSAAGILALVLPILLLPALTLGVSDLGEANFIQSFPIAVRDLDNTIMSKTLLNQLRNIQLFSEVRVLEEGETDAEAIADGAAAVATVPEDFFYDLYNMRECPVEVTLNSEKPTESSLFESVFTTIMGIIRSNHASYLGAYTFAYGELTPELIRTMHSKSGNSLAMDALGRQKVFQSMTADTDAAGALSRRLGACLLSVLALFFALSSAKTLPEELGLGVIPRLRAARFGLGPFLLSKLTVAYLLSLPAVLAVSLLAWVDLPYLMAVYALLLLAAFGLMAALAALTPSGPAAQRWGNLLLLLSLALGGTLFPAPMLPGFLRPLTKLTLPYYASLALEARVSDFALWRIAGLLWPLGLMALLGAAAAALSLRSGKGRAGGESDRTASASDMPEPSVPRTRGLTARLANLTALRFRLVTGGRATLAATLAGAVICGLAAASLYVPAAASLRLCVTDRDGTEASESLIRHLRESAGVDVLVTDRREAEMLLLIGEREGLIVIGRGYEDALREDGDVPLSFEASALSMTSQGARELVAGAAMSELRRAQAPAVAGELMGRELTEAERRELDELISDFAADLPDTYRVTWTAGEAPADPFAPSPMAFAALAVLFSLLTAASFTATAENRAAASRLRSLPGGRMLAQLPDLIALTLFGTLVAALVLIPQGLKPDRLWVLALAALDLTAFALLLARFTGREGRVDSLSALLALLICLLGGCFMDLTALAAPLRALTLISPAGLAARAFDGSAAACVLLALEAAALTALACAVPVDTKR